MRRFLLSACWVVIFLVLAAIVSGLLNGLFIASGIANLLGDKAAYIGVAFTDVLLLGAVVLSICLSVRGHLPGTRKAKPPNRVT
mgnify:CR=1 FL=1